ncbi:MAG: DUF86 domain-containing protein [Thermoanaerobaculia bacterium]
MTSREEQSLLDILIAATDALTKATEVSVPDLPWRKMKNLRNVIVHDYEGVNLSIVWQIVNEELPGVIAALREHFPEGQ